LASKAEELWYGTAVSIDQNPQRLAVLNDVVENLIQGVVLELEPFPDQLPGGEAHSRLLEELVVVGAEKTKKKRMKKHTVFTHQRTSNTRVIIIQSLEERSERFLQQTGFHFVLRVFLRQETREVEHGRVEAAADVPPRGGRLLGDEQLGAAEVADVDQLHGAGCLLDALQHGEPCLAT
jgi:hypothetical protein